MLPPAAIIVPTRGRPHYLDRALASIAPQAAALGAEVIVVDDGPEISTRTVAEAHGASYISEGAGDGLNAARNRGVTATDAELLIFTDDDVEVHPGWLLTLLEGAAEQPEQVGVFSGPIHARIEDHRFRACGREGWPITTTELGPSDADCVYAWGSNMMIRRSAFEAVGLFDPLLPVGGDEQEWEERWRASGGRIRYLAAAAVDHVRCGDDSRLSSLCDAARGRGRVARRFDETRGTAPSIWGELRVFAGCLWHGPRRLCSMGPVTAAHSWGRIESAISRKPLSGAPVISGVNDFMSGSGGQVSGRRAKLLALADRATDLRETLSRRALQRDAAASPRRSVLVLTIASDHGTSLLAEQRAELERSHHDVELRAAPAAGAGKFENLNALIEAADRREYDWVVVLDDDVNLPRGFLDSFLFAAEAAGLQIAQPAHRLHSHAAWPITRRRRGVRSRRTTFVEIGPVTAFAPAAAAALIPFPKLRTGWGLDAHWAAIAAQRGWPIGIVDATPVGHTLRPVAADYPREDAIAEAQEFLRGRPYLRSDEIRTVGIQR
jgi:GT2 family glycosyltransferase